MAISHLGPVGVPAIPEASAWDRGPVGRAPRGQRHPAEAAPSSADRVSLSTAARALAAGKKSPELQLSAEQLRALVSPESAKVPLDRRAPEPRPAGPAATPRPEPDALTRLFAGVTSAPVPAPAAAPTRTVEGSTTSEDHHVR